MSDNAAYDVGLLLPFDDPDPEFTRGFECGRLWALLRAWPEAEPLGCATSPPPKPLAKKITRKGDKPAA